MNSDKNYSEQELFWAGNFGDDYTERNSNEDLMASNIHLFSNILSYTKDISSVIEFGANRGLNLIALKHLLPKVQLSAVEINARAVSHLKTLSLNNIWHQSILDTNEIDPHDLALFKGVLIHVNPEDLFQAYDVCYKASNRYIVLCEYYNPTPVEVAYRGHHKKLFKRDFAGEMLDRFKDLRVVHYG